MHQLNELDIALFLEKSRFEVLLNFNIDLNTNKNYIELEYLIEPKNKRFMCACLLLNLATRIIWLAQNNLDEDLGDALILFYSDFYRNLDKITFMTKPKNNHFVKVYSVGTEDRYNFQLDYEGFVFGGMFNRELPVMTVCAFMTLYKYIFTHLVPDEDMEFHNNLLKILSELSLADFHNIEMIEIRNFCMTNAMSIAYK